MINKYSKYILILASIILISIVGFYFSFSFQKSFTFNLSPVPNRYISNFIDGLHLEEQELTYYNWAKDKSVIFFPLKVLNTDIQIQMRIKRFIKYQAYLYVYVNNNLTFIKNLQGAKYEIVTFNVPRQYLDREDLNITFRILSNETRREKGMRVDWIKVLVPQEGKVVPSSEQWSEFIIFLFLNITLFQIFKISIRKKAFLTCIPILIFILVNSIYRVEVSHLIFFINRLVYLPSLAIIILMFIFNRYKKTSDLISNSKSFININHIISIFYVSQIVRVIGTFYYQYFYPDLRSYFKYMTVLNEQGIFGFSWWYAHHHLKILYNLEIPFPYSPLFHIFVQPFNSIYHDYYFWLRFLSITLNTLIVVLVYFIAKKIFDSDLKAIFASIFISFSPLMFNRIFLCMYAGLFSSFLFVLFLSYLIVYKDQLNRVSIRWGGIIILSLCLLSYPSALLDMILLLIIFFILMSKKDKKSELDAKMKFSASHEIKPLFTIFIVSCAIVFFTYYIYFVPSLFSKLLPFLAEKGSGISWSQEIPPGFFEYLIRRMIFYLSVPGILIAIPGIYLIFKEKIDHFHKRLLTAWFSMWSIIYILAAPGLLSFILRLGKEGIYTQPLFALGAGATLYYLWNKNKFLKILTVLLLAVYISLSLYHWADNISSFMHYIE